MIQFKQIKNKNQTRASEYTQQIADERYRDLVLMINAATAMEDDQESIAGLGEVISQVNELIKYYRLYVVKSGTGGNNGGGSSNGGGSQGGGTGENGGSNTGGGDNGGSSGGGTSTGGDNGGGSNTGGSGSGGSGDDEPDQ
ncbi:MAG: hypothetical protein IK075_00155 [Prevotella sp.]|nr:hypothetical protein [Prevotella sp.]